MTMIQTILLFAVLAIWLCISAVILIRASSPSSMTASAKSVSVNRRPVTQSITKTA